MIGNSKTAYNMEKFDLLLAKLSDDDTSGAEQLVPKALEAMHAAIEDEEASDEELAGMLSTLVETIRESLPEITPLLKFADRIEELPEKNLRQTALELEREIRETRERETSSVASLAANLIRENSTVATISQSSTVLTTFFSAKAMGKEFHIIVPVGEPSGEGLLTAKALSENGIDVTVVPDSGAALAVQKADLVLVGADAITRDFFLNKIGTLPLAIAARHYGVPCYVCARLEKFIPAEKLSRAGRTIDPDDLGLQKTDLITVSAPLFERTPHTLITGIITEGGIVTPEKGVVEIAEQKDD
ncbi:hypothetical protein DRQ36_01755 [bacterium]|nr:MAG: hypothetical protein DRQ36_01755 [bacterium]